MTPAATLERPGVTDRPELSDQIVATPPPVTRETTVRQIMQEAQVDYKKAEAFLDQILDITQKMKRWKRRKYHLSRTQIGELHHIFKIVMKPKVSRPDEGTAHWMINRQAFPGELTLGLMHSSTRAERMVWCDAAIVNVGA